MPPLPPLTSASTGDQGKPHGTEVVGPGEGRKIQSGVKPFQRHREYHEALSLWSAPRVDGQSLTGALVWGQKSLTHLVLMAITQPHLEASIPLHNSTSRVSAHLPGFKCRVNGKTHPTSALRLMWSPLWAHIDVNDSSLELTCGEALNPAALLGHSPCLSSCPQCTRAEAAAISQAATTSGSAKP